MNNQNRIHDIVLVDDEPSVLLALKLLLSALGFAVQDFQKPEDALGFISNGGTCDLLLSDLRMPGLTGTELLRKIRAIRPELAFVLISGHATDEDVTAARELGVTGFLGKPFTPDQLKEMIRKVSEG